MKKSTKKFFLLGLFLFFIGCNKDDEDDQYINMSRTQFEREIFSKGNISDEEKASLMRMKDVSADFAYYRELPIIRGYTQGDDSSLFLVQVIIAYNFKNKKLSLELAKRREVLIDRIRNRLMRLPADDFSSSKEEYLRATILKEVNGILKTGQAEDILLSRIETYAVPQY